jgi:hypothetical protein
VVDRVALGQVFSEYFNFPCQFSFRQMLYTHLSSEVGIIVQLVADIPSGLSIAPSQETKKTYYTFLKKKTLWFRGTPAAENAHRRPATLFVSSLGPQKLAGLITLDMMYRKVLQKKSTIVIWKL